MNGPTADQIHEILIASWPDESIIVGESTSRNIWPGVRDCTHTSGGAGSLLYLFPRLILEVSWSPNAEIFSLFNCSVVTVVRRIGKIGEINRIATF